jgi:hypothetical protein
MDRKADIRTPKISFVTGQHSTRGAKAQETKMQARKIPQEQPSYPRQAGIQYAAASRFYHWRLWNTGSSAFADDDIRIWSNPPTTGASVSLARTPLMR